MEEEEGKRSAVNGTGSWRRKVRECCEWNRIKEEEDERYDLRLTQ